MGHYNPNRNHTCDAEEHDFTDEQIVSQTVKIVIHDGEPCLMARYHTEYRCSKEGEKYRRNTENVMRQCEETKRGRHETKYIPLDSIGDVVEMNVDSVQG
jgi:hypothetical protein